MSDIIAIRKTKAAILAESKKPLVIDEVELPERLECGQVLVRVQYSGICGSQLGEIDAVKGVDKYLPHLLGHEASGTVLQCGPGVRHVAVGNLCVMHWRKSLGIEAIPPSYRWNGKTCNAGPIATFCQYAVVSENRLTPVRAQIDPAILPLFGCAITTGLGVVRNDAKIRVGESLLVVGAGGVGLNVIQGAAMAGAWPIVAADQYENRLDLAKKFGATHGILSSSGNLPETARAILGECGIPEGFDIAIDNTGNATVIGQCYELVSPQGRVILVGVPRSGDKASLYTLPLHFGKSITGSHGGGTVPQEDIPRYLRLMQAGKLNLKGLVTEHFKLEEINSAIGRMRSGEAAGRCVVTCMPQGNS